MATKRPARKRDEIERFLRNILKEGPKRYNEIEQAAEAAKISLNTMEKSVQRWPWLVRRPRNGYSEWDLGDRVDGTSTPFKSPLWPFPSIYLPSLTDAELIRILDTTDDPLIIRLLSLLPPDKVDVGCEDYNYGYREAMIEVGVHIREIEGKLETPEPSVTRAFTELLNRIDESISEAVGTESHENPSKPLQI